MRSGPDQRPRGRFNANRPFKQQPRGPLNQTFDSNGPDIRVRGSAYQIFERYVVWRAKRRRAVTELPPRISTNTQSTIFGSLTRAAKAIGRGRRRGRPLQPTSGRTHPRQRQEKVTASNLNGTATLPSPRRAQLTKNQTAPSRQPTRTGPREVGNHGSRPARMRGSETPFADQLTCGAVQLSDGRDDVLADEPADGQCQEQRSQLIEAIVASDRHLSDYRLDTREERAQRARRAIRRAGTGRLRYDRDSTKPGAGNASAR